MKELCEICKEGSWRIRTHTWSVALVFEVGFYVEVAVGGEFVVPLFAEALYEGLSEELIEADFVFATNHFSAFANFPAVIVDSGE